MPTSPVFAGLDLGTSGCRVIAIDDLGAVVAEIKTTYPQGVQCHGDAVEQDPGDWWLAARAALSGLAERLRGRPLARLALDGTSGTVLLTSADGHPLSPALMYNDRRARDAARRIAAVAPRSSAAHGTASGLAKALWLRDNTPGLAADCRLMHQADWICRRLGAPVGVSDANNCLKTGYDPVLGVWPDWLDSLLPRHWLPRVVSPGTPLGTLDPGLCRQLGLAAGEDGIALLAGTTDSTAAVMATGVAAAGDAVTSLGSTLVLKVLSEQPVSAPEYGVYSQPLGHLWLVGGGSNSGGNVLRHYFSDEALARLSASMDLHTPSGLDYYPLLHPGERFPVNDPDLPPRLAPVPQDRQLFLQGLFEGMAKIEQQGYELLQRLGAPWPRRLYSVGGGADNPAWTHIRRDLLGIEMLPAQHQEAAYGVALLARDAAV